MSIGLSADTNLSHYRIVSKIGAGGMGEVYLANDTKLDRKVALKVLTAEVAADEERVRRFVQEAKAASALNHQNILTIFEIGTFEGSHYIATELIDGKTLRDRKRSGDLSLTEAVRIALQAAAALAAAHDAGIIHRDIKPENIMIREDKLVKVLDFGLAKLTEKYADTAAPEDATKAQMNTEPGVVMGTVNYMSPEQARGRALDARSDIFSLGIVMYELFGGQRPFQGESNVDVISSIIKDEPAPLRQLAPNIPR
ncbi:MAG: serine/threonine protein kinase, partial [Pyrinomonadaceae bacterium]